MMRKVVALWFIVVLLAVSALAQQKPKVRAITAFVRLERATYDAQVRDTLAFLRKAKATFEQRGYEVESLRITTQPFPDLVRGLKHDEALAFLRSYDELAQRENFDTSLGPAMITDSDDPAAAHLLAEALAASKILEGSIIIAAEDGIHWKAIAAAAEVIKYLE